MIFNYKGILFYKMFVLRLIFGKEWCFCFQNQIKEVNDKQMKLMWANSSYFWFGQQIIKWNSNLRTKQLLLEVVEALERRSPIFTKVRKEIDCSNALTNTNSWARKMEWLWGRNNVMTWALDPFTFCLRVRLYRMKVLSSLIISRFISNFWWIGQNQGFEENSWYQTA
jgi:hypothetical protein